MANPIPGTMIVSDPWEQAFADYQQALVDLNGDGVPDAAVSPDGQMQPFRIGDQRKPMGLPRVAQPGMDTTEPATGRFSNLLPYVAGAALGPVMAAAGRMAPNALAALVGGYGMTANSQEASPQTALRRAQERELEMQRRQQQLQQEAEAARQEREQQGARQAADDRLSADIKRQAAEAEQVRINQQLEREMAEKIAREERNKTFVEKYPGVADVLPAIGLGAAALVPAAGKILSQRARNAPMREWHATVRETEDALAKRNMLLQPRPDVRAAGDGTAKLAEFNTSYPRGELRAAPSLPFYQPSPGMISAGMFGGAAAAESSMFPDQWNALNLPEDNPERAASRARALNPLYYLERGAMGALTGSSGYKAGSQMYPDIRGPIEASRGLVNRYGTTPESVNRSLETIARGQAQVGASGQRTSRQISSERQQDNQGSREGSRTDQDRLPPPEPVPTRAARGGAYPFNLSVRDQKALENEIIAAILRNRNSAIPAAVAATTPLNNLLALYGQEPPAY